MTDGAGLGLADLAYELPPDLIAQHPMEPRDASRLLVFRRGDGSLEDRGFAELPRLLRRGDVLVRNDTRVLPARTGFRRATGGRVEVLFLRPRPDTASGAGEPWEALLRGRVRSGERLDSTAPGASWTLLCERRLGGGRWVVVSESRRPVVELLREAGVMPLPPYIKATLGDPERYQTTYARVEGSAAAPTAGLHFTPAVDAALEAAGVTVETVTLHVGLGTFQPLRHDSLAANHLHAEQYAVGADVWDRVVAARDRGARVIAVGTTSLRVLEHLAAGEGAPDESGAYRGETTLFIRPGFRFRLADGLLTNFHLPGTSLLALVMAFCGVDATRRLYAHAVERRYRFYSFGDAMLALPGGCAR
jgi:S-adenosylmethionine:tRNA ribosyltransferase-isomerase